MECSGATGAVARPTLPRWPVEAGAAVVRLRRSRRLVCLSYVRWSGSATLVVATAARVNAGQPSDRASAGGAALLTQVRLRVSLASSAGQRWARVRSESADSLTASSFGIICTGGSCNGQAGTSRVNISLSHDATGQTDSSINHPVCLQAHGAAHCRQRKAETG